MVSLLMLGHHHLLDFGTGNATAVAIKDDTDLIELGVRYGNLGGVSLRSHPIEDLL